MSRSAVSLALLVVVVVCASLGVSALWSLIDQPWNDADEPFWPAGWYVAIFAGLAVLFLGAALALATLLARRTGIVGRHSQRPGPPAR
ncbi:MAG: hypothetical protein WEB04_08115 [Dehalococcoidia bacterium]